MKSHIRLFALLGFLAVAPLASVGCGGVECGPDTTDKDGKCVPKFQEVTCADGTALNEETGACELEAPPLECGAGTEEDGGSCVVAAPACGEGTQLDANSATCAPSDEACGDGLAFSDGECQPTDEVCDTGTTFSDDTGLCMPEATCQEGDVILNGNCVRAAQELAANADVTSSEDDDPTYGGAANSLTLTDGEQTVFSGDVDAPTDLNADSAPDQDIDVYTFDATAGQVFTVSVQPLEGPAMGFTVTDESGDWVRYSDAGFASGSARQVVVPADGTYYIRVAPASYIVTDGDFGPTGEDGWSYVGTLEQDDALSATDVDTSAANVTGELAGLSDNFFKLTNLTQGEGVLLTPTVGADAEAVLSIWTSPTDHVGTFALENGTAQSIELPTGDVYVFVDWIRVWGVDSAFDIEITAFDGNEDLGAIAAGDTATSSPAPLLGDEELTYDLSAEAGEVLEFSHANDSDQAVDFVVTDGTGAEVLNVSGFETGSYEYLYVPSGAQYSVTVTNPTSDDHANFVLTTNSITPADEGDHQVGDQVDVLSSATLELNRHAYHLVTLSADALIEGTLTASTGDVDLSVWDASGAEVFSAATLDDESFREILPAGSYVFDIAAGEELTDGYQLTFDLIDPPFVETEPNNDAASATVLPSGLPAHFAGDSGPQGGDLDYFQFTVSAETAVSAELSTFGSSGFCGRVELHDDSGNVLDGADGDGAVAADLLQPGDYYVVLTGWCSSTTGAYNYEVNLTGVQPVCGDGIHTSGEACEDGNTADGDGCSQTCTLEGTPISVANSGSVISVTGELDGSDPTWERSLGDCTTGFGDIVAYETFEIVNNTGSSQTLTVTGEWDSFDGYLHAFSQPFDDTSPTTNCVAGDDDFNSTADSQMPGVSIADGETLVLVASGYNDADFGTYSIEIATD